MLFPAPLTLPRQIKESVDEISKAALAANADGEFTVFGIAGQTTFLLSSGSSPHFRSPCK
jgi:hypothetical protein